MFGTLSFSKLLILVAIVVVVWYGFKLVGQLDRARKENERVTPRGAGRSRGRRGPVAEVEDMAKCPRCEAYVPSRTAQACGRSDCPYPLLRRDAA